MPVATKAILQPNMSMNHATTITPAAPTATAERSSPNAVPRRWMNQLATVVSIAIMELRLRPTVTSSMNIR